VVTAQLTAQSIIEPGNNYGQLRILLENEVITSFDFVLLVRPFRGIGAVESSSEANIFDKAVEQAAEQFQEDAEQIVEEVKESIPADYTALTEEVGQLNERIEDVDERVEALEAGGAGSGLTEDIKAALLQLASKVAYIDEHGQDYYDDLYDALYAITAITLDSDSITLQTIGATSQLTATTTPAGGNVTWSSSNTSVATVSSTGLVTSVAYGSATITATAGSVSAMCSVVVAQATCTGITATYTQSGTVYYNTNLDALKSDLVVTASWSDGTTTTLNASDYTLSGTLVEGTSTITVSYGGQTDTFSVTVAPYYYPMTITDTSDGVGFGPIDKTKNTMIPPYVASSSNHRLHCIGDNIGYPVNYGKTYKVTIQDATTTVGIVATCFNQAGKSQLENIQAVSSTNSNETTWLDVDNQTFTFTPTLINGTEPVCMWLVFRRSSENARWKAVTDMTPITIEELDGE
jgi:hypothetical protein